ncbi:hypothetical protein, partial [Streptomyces boluensis]
AQPQPPQPDGGNPYAQAPSGPGPGAPPPMPPQAPPGPPAGPPPATPQQGFPGQPPAQPQFPQQQPPMPGMQQQLPYPGAAAAGARGSAAGAFFLGLLVSVVVSLIYAGIFFGTYKNLTDMTTVNIVYMAHAVINGAAVGAVAGLIGRRNNAAHVAAAIVAVLGAFFGQANAAFFVQMDVMGSDVYYLLQEKPFFPAEMWWGRDVESGMLSLLGLLLAVLAGWGIARLVGSRR